MAGPVGNDQKSPEPTVSRRIQIAVAVMATVLLLAWAIATVFEIQMIKAFAMVVLVVFGVIIALLMVGVG